jgi:predicted nicotinamide N-methyase
MSDRMTCLPLSANNDIGATGQSRFGEKGSATLLATRARLLSRIRRRFAVLTEDVPVGPLHLSFTRIEDPNRVLDEVAAEEDRLEKVKGQRVSEDQLHLPYWAELWDSAMGVSRHLERMANEEFFPRLSALDLGCGMGLTGTVAAALGARVMFADLEAPALLFARLNSLPWVDRVRTRRLDWRKHRLGERFDLIIGADILYERKQWDHLEPFWREHLRPGGLVVLGEPGRRTGELFIDWIQGRGWRLQQLAEPVETRSTPIRLFRLTLSH